MKESVEDVKERKNRVRIVNMRKEQSNIAKKEGRSERTKSQPNVAGCNTTCASNLFISSIFYVSSSLSKVFLDFDGMNRASKRKEALEVDGSNKPKHGSSYGLIVCYKLVGKANWN